MSLIEPALRYLSAGMSVIPIDHRNKKPFFPWGKYKSVKPTVGEIRDWFGGNTKAMACITGTVSGNIVVFDFDIEGYYARWREIIGDVADTLPTQRTGGGGYQVFLKCDKPGRNSKLAFDINQNGEKRIAIETREEGGYVLIPPSLHPSGGTYAWIPGSPRVIPKLDADTVDMLYNAARSLDATPEPEEFVKAKSESPRRRKGTNVIEAYNQAHDIESLLLSYGYTRRGRYLCRPGAPDRHSVWLHEGKSYHHSTNDPLHSEHMRDAFDVYAHFEHGGKYREAVKAAAAELGIETRPRPKGSPFDALNKVESLGEDAEAPFWYIKESNEGYTPGILQHRISDYLYRKGFTKIYPRHEVESVFVRIIDNVCSLSSQGQMKDFFMNYVRSLPNPLPEVGGCEFRKAEVMEKLERGAATHFGMAQLECIPTATPQFSRDTKDSAYFYFANGFAKVTKNGTDFRDYSQLEGVIWERQKLAREYRAADGPDGEFSRFLFNVCGRDLQRFSAMRTALGYMLHQYKDRSLTKAIVFIDETISETPEGRSGKSLVSTALCQLRNGLLLDGKKLNFDSPFAFQGVSLDTDIVVMDDVTKSFDYEMIFHMITSDFTVERKNEHARKIDFEDAPKILISTNYMIQGEGGSADARKAEYEFSAHYHAGYSPRDEFGHNLFDDWDAEEWARFDQFMMDSVTLYLQSSLIQPVSININERKLLQSTNQDFVDFMDGKASRNEVFNIWIPKNVLLDELCLESEECKRNKERGKLSMNKFSAWLKSYERRRGLVLSEKIMWREGKSLRGIMFTEK